MANKKPFSILLSFFSLRHQWRLLDYGRQDFAPRWPSQRKTPCTKLCCCCCCCWLLKDSTSSSPPPVWLCFVDDIQPNFHCLVDFRQKPEWEASLALSHCSSPPPPPLPLSPPCTPPHLHSLQFLLNYLLTAELFTVRSKHFFLRPHLHKAPDRIW
jgi:hypothetical protein